MVSGEEESGASVVNNGKDMLYHKRPYHKCCDNTGSKKSPLIRKTRECAAWDDKSNIAVIEK